MRQIISQERWHWSSSNVPDCSHQGWHFVPLIGYAAEVDKASVPLKKALQHQYMIQIIYVWPFIANWNDIYQLFSRVISWIPLMCGKILGVLWRFSDLQEKISLLLSFLLFQVQLTFTSVATNVTICIINIDIHMGSGNAGTLFCLTFPRHFHPRWPVAVLQVTLSKSSQAFGVYMWRKKGKCYDETFFP